MTIYNEADIIEVCTGTYASRLRASLKALDWYISDGHFSRPDGPGAMALQRVEDRLNELAAEVATRRAALMGNAPRRVRVA